ncbi:hypothetical protein CDA63_16430 [Hymenobacter amundsenii]|uniref:Uncharacterized protein n=1 Tax=Hymenobacter amundsenii TaxID=2006685 RepID=A0A246FK91_9BACT|nr:hypothetical protein [Hymenobacter amundsenii]OWP62015.1 hypothetical protein CDA63_16430 [Hymenobacter amundsenii]
MKTTLLTLALAAATFTASAQTLAAQPATATAAVAAPADSYTALMTGAIAELMNTGDPAVLRASAAKMERAASVKPQDWLPRYYQAYALLINVFQSKEDGDAKDQTLDRAEAALAQARKLGGADESELLVLQAYIYQARLGISPMLRSMKYSGMVNEAVAKAKALNPANPRAYLVQANNVYYTPAMFGGGAEVAKPLYQEAQARFAAFKPASSLAPNWGEWQLKGRLKSYETAAAK